jgi:hypothetical protein
MENQVTNREHRTARTKPDTTGTREHEDYYDVMASLSTDSSIGAGSPLTDRRFIL